MSYFLLDALFIIPGIIYFAKVEYQAKRKNRIHIIIIGVGLRLREIIPIYIIRECITILEINIEYRTLG